MLQELYPVFDVPLLCLCESVNEDCNEVSSKISLVMLLCLFQ